MADAAARRSCARASSRSTPTSPTRAAPRAACSRPALFLGEFVGEGIPWSHLDIAGPAFNDKAPAGYWPKGGTGFGVRTLVGLAESYV